MDVNRLVFGFPLLLGLLVSSGTAGEPFSMGGAVSEAFQFENSGPHSELLNSQKLVEVLHVGCTDDEKCVVIAFTNDKHFNEADMRKAAEELSEIFEDKNVVNVDIFDRKDLAEAYVKGVRNIGQSAAERRGWYLKMPDREFLLFFPDREREKKQIAVKLFPKE